MNRHSPPHQRLAIALEYDGEGAPTVTAKGANDLADAIVALAQSHDVPVHGDQTLARLLSQVDVDEEIPERLYRVVAEVLAFAYLLKGRTPDG
ncbi:EscU/YscU/HrcU family type III secretion system export apparatus switch protein [Aquisalimonas asiatica]|uniref:Flagellar biosynthetic protein FlhB n=1 Tax=Aquisalimonas asiatica TaxID=406100 RepID=A0A1H8QRK9_9GAMM|nr:EscU/YscU/HrcU family type III secretion system export apparatus switch protein [Aquisalimonas asiatica]SEO56869.1 flagellar biosynthesis protein [Aquisalimonas asiatica]